MARIADAKIERLVLARLLTLEAEDLVVVGAGMIPPATEAGTAVVTLVRVDVDRMGRVSQADADTAIVTVVVNIEHERPDSSDGQAGSGFGITVMRDRVVAALDQYAVSDADGQHHLYLKEAKGRNDDPEAGSGNMRSAVVTVVGTAMRAAGDDGLDLD